MDGIFQDVKSYFTNIFKATMKRLEMLLQRLWKQENNWLEAKRD